MVKLTISMAIFNSFLYVYQRLVLDPHNNNKWHVVFVFRVPRFPTRPSIRPARKKINGTPETKQVRPFIVFLGSGLVLGGKDSYNPIQYLCI